MIPQIISSFHFGPTINKTYRLVPHFFLRLPNKSSLLSLTQIMFMVEQTPTANSNCTPVWEKMSSFYFSFVSYILLSCF